MDRLLEEFHKKYDDYEIISSIGKDTWQIRLKSYDRLAVLKRVDNPDVYKRLSSLKIKGIPVVYSVFERDGYSYAIEELVNGTALDSILASRGKLSAREVRDIVIKLCKILTPLHSAHIIHRDIKPSNIILTSDNSVYLIDFGIARAKTDTSTGDTKHLGTEFYASPEQYGFAQSDNRSDIYSIGRLMLVLLTGKENADSIRRLPYGGIISKCTQIDSKKRYPDVRCLQRAFGAKILVAVILVFAMLSVAVICVAERKVPTDTEEYATEMTTAITTDAETQELSESTTDNFAVETITETTTLESQTAEVSTEQTTVATTSRTTSNTTEAKVKTDTPKLSDSIVHEYASEAVTDANGYITNSLEFDNITYYKNVCFDRVSAEDNPYMLIEPGWTKQVGEIQLFEGKLTPVYAEQTKSGLSLTLNGKTLFLPNTEAPYSHPNLKPTGRIYTIAFVDFDSDGIREILPVELAYYNDGGTKITRLYSTARFIRVNADMSMTLCGGEAVIADNADDYIYIEDDGVVVYNMDLYKNIAYKLNGNTVVKK